MSVVTYVSPPKNCFLLHKNPMHPYFFCIGLFQKKAKQGGWGHGTSRDIEKIECKIPGVNKKGVEFPRVIKKTFCGISRSEASFCLEFPRVKWLIQKFQGSFSKKYILKQSNHLPPSPPPPPHPSTPPPFPFHWTCHVFLFVFCETYLFENSKH